MLNIKLNKETYQITPQQRTRPPVVHHFWRIAIIFALLLGFPSGIYLWLYINHQLDELSGYTFLLSVHSTIQLLGFFGLFILGFLYTAGYHLNGGSPRPIKHITWVLPALITGIILKLYPPTEVIGNSFITLAFGFTGYVMLVAAKEGGFSRPAHSTLTLLGLITFSVAPWLNLLDPHIVLYVVLGGPVLFVLLAGLQLIFNVMKGSKLEGLPSSTFAIQITIAYTLLTVHTFVKPVALYFISLSFLLPVVYYIVKVRLISGIKYCGPTSLALAFILGFSWLITSLLLLAIHGGFFMENTIHLIVLGQISTHILAVGSRVIGFFSGEYVIAEEKLIGLILFWQIVPVTRGLDILLDFPYFTSWITSAVTGIVFVLWSFLMFAKIRKV
ncbi:MAG: NnrS family protein [Nitrospinae bacterium]|nr:NnrS family protein [Nitrospinota bacterium]